MHRTCIQLISKSIQCTINKSRFPKKKNTYLIQYFRVRIYLVVFKMLNLFRTRNNKYSKEKIRLPQVTPSPLFTKKLNPRHIGRDLHNLRTYHYKHNKRAISLSPTTVKVRKINLVNQHIFISVATLNLSKGANVLSTKQLMQIFSRGFHGCYLTYNQFFFRILGVEGILKDIAFLHTRPRS